METDYVSKFNEQIINFVEEMKKLDVEDEFKKYSYLLSYKNMIRIKNNNRLLYLELFKKYFKDDVRNRLMVFEKNEEYLLNNFCDNTNIIKEEGLSYFSLLNYIGVDKNILKLIFLKLKKRWCNLDKVEKENIWKYLKILIYYSDRVDNIDTVELIMKLKRCVM